MAGKSKQRANAATGKVVGEFGPIPEPDRAAFLAGRTRSTSHNVALSAQRIEQIPRLENWRPDSARHLLAPTISIIPTLIAAGRVAHDVMTAIKSGSAGDDCGSLSVSTALATALVAFVAFKYALFSSGSFTRASVFEIVLRAARLGSARGRVG